MRRFISVGLVVPALFVSACTMPPQQDDPHIVAEAARPVTCERGIDCEKKWATVLLWVQNNSVWKIRNVTDSLVTTEGPMETSDAAFVITKVPVNEHEYRFDFKAVCGSPIGYCYPHIAELQASFVTAIMGPQVN